MKPRLLDLFCGAGGAAMGYHRAGFEVYGVDIKEQPHYQFPFLKMDALEAMDRLLRGEGLTFSNGETLYLEDFDAYHASPPCQHASTIAKQNRAMRPGIYIHPNLIPETRERILATGKPFVIENVPGAKLIELIILCGSWFGLDVRRHRIFESNVPILSTPCSHQWQKPRFRSLDARHKGLSSVVGVHGHIKYAGEGELRARAMVIDWMPDESHPPGIHGIYRQILN